MGKGTRRKPVNDGITLELRCDIAERKKDAAQSPEAVDFILTHPHESDDRERRLGRSIRGGRKYDINQLEDFTLYLTDK